MISWIDFNLFAFVWVSALAGACASEYVRRRWETRKRSDRLPDDWTPPSWPRRPR